ncbi:DUF4397 domain-containing protein [Natronoarchaeum sp. GCM10025703]
MGGDDGAGSDVDPTEDAVIDEEIEVSTGIVTAAVIGEAAEDADQELELSVQKADLSELADGDSRVRAVHASPDAPEVDIVADDNPLVEGLTFGNSETFDVAEGEYTLEVREAGQDESVADFDVTLDAGVVYSAFAVGFLEEQGGDSGGMGDSEDNGSDSAGAGDSEDNGSDSGGIGDSEDNGSDSGGIGDSEDNGSDSGGIGDSEDNGSDSGGIGDSEDNGSDSGGIGDSEDNGSDSGGIGDSEDNGSDSGGMGDSDTGFDLLLNVDALTPSAAVEETAEADDDGEDNGMGDDDEDDGMGDDDSGVGDDSDGGTDDDSSSL